MLRVAGLVLAAGSSSRLGSNKLLLELARRGVGRRILHTCEEAARLEGFRRLELVATLPGERLYAALGYHALERIEIVLAGGQDLPAVRMEKGLGAPDEPATAARPQQSQTL